MYTVIGKCSICSGEVRLDTVVGSVVPPKPKCISCGAVKKDNTPIIEMEDTKDTRKFLID